MDCWRFGSHHSVLNLALLKKWVQFQLKVQLEFKVRRELSCFGFAYGILISELHSQL